MDIGPSAAVDRTRGAETHIITPSLKERSRRRWGCPPAPRPEHSASAIHWCLAPSATEVLRGTAEKRAKDLAAKNSTRVSLLERLQKLIDEYNTGSMEIDELFRQLMAFVGDLDAEEQRHVRQGLSEEELVIFDIRSRSRS